MGERLSNGGLRTTENSDSAGTVTDDHTETSRFVAAVDFGVLKVNETTIGVELHVPFSEMNASFSAETYRERGEEGWTTSPSRPSTTAVESRTVGKFQSHWPARWSWMVTLHERCW
jgi:hypothetical protein